MITVKLASRWTLLSKKANIGISKPSVPENQTKQTIAWQLEDVKGSDEEQEMIHSATYILTPF
jgi:hypothetical protein